MLAKGGEFMEASNQENGVALTTGRGSLVSVESFPSPRTLSYRGDHHSRPCQTTYLQVWEEPGIPTVILYLNVVERPMHGQH